MPPTLPNRPASRTFSTWLASELRLLAERARLASGEEFSLGHDAEATSWRLVKDEILSLAARLPETTLSEPSVNAGMGKGLR